MVESKIASRRIPKRPSAEKIFYNSCRRWLGRGDAGRHFDGTVSAKQTFLVVMLWRCDYCIIVKGLGRRELGLMVGGESRIFRCRV